MEAPLPLRFFAPVSREGGQGSGGVGAVRAEGLAQVGDRCVELVDLDGDAVARGGQFGAVGEGGAGAVGGGELDVAVGDDAGGDDDGPGVGGDADALVEVEPDADAGALRFDGLDLSDPDAEDAQVGAGVDADRPVEVGGDAGAVGFEDAYGGESAGGEHHEGESGGEAFWAWSSFTAPLPVAGCFGGRHPVVGCEASGR